MPDRSRSGEDANERRDRKRISSAVVVSKSFQKVQDKRNSPEPIRERRYRKRSPDNVRDSDRRTSRLHMDRDENREDRRKRISDRLGPRKRRSEEHVEHPVGKEDEGDKLRQRNERFSRRGRSPQRRTVFDRLEQGPPRGRGAAQGETFRDQRMIEIDVNPQDVPRGKRYFLHDDREVPRRQKNDRSRARSRSPVWVHDKFDECEAMDEEEEKDTPQAESDEAKVDNPEISPVQERVDERFVQS